MLHFYQVLITYFSTKYVVIPIFSKVVDFVHPEILEKQLDLSIPQHGQTDEKLLEFCEDTIRYSVKTGHSLFYINVLLVFWRKVINTKYLNMSRLPQQLSLFITTKKQFCGMGNLGTVTLKLIWTLYYDRCNRTLCYDRCNRTLYYDRCNRTLYYDRCNRTLYYDRCNRTLYYDRCNRTLYYDRCNRMQCPLVRLSP